jgi:hypothetical protein
MEARTRRWGTYTRELESLPPRESGQQEEIKAMKSKGGETKKRSYGNDDESAEKCRIPKNPRRRKRKSVGSR